MPLFRKKPVVIEAIRFVDDESVTEILAWADGAVLFGVGAGEPEHLLIETLEGRIVERIRRTHAEIVESDGGECPLMATFREAADEIERLETRIVGLEAMLCDAQAEAEKLSAQPAVPLAAGNPERKSLIGWLERMALYLAGTGATHPYPPTPEQFRRWAEAVK